MKQFTSIVLSGGSLWTISAIGALKRLHEDQNIGSTVKNFVGTSAGAIICTCLTIGYTPQECYDFLMNEYVDKYPITFDPLEALEMLDTYGLTSAKPLDILLDLIFKKKNISQDITFLELAKLTGKNLVICVSNVNHARSEFWCVDETPGIPVKVALRATCSIPLIITPVTYKGNIYCDGCIYNNFPITYFKENLLKDIFAVRITDFLPSQKLDSAVHYFWRIVSSMIYTITELNIQKFNSADNIVTLSLNCSDVCSITNDTLELKINKDAIARMYQEGYKKAHDVIVNQRQQQQPPQTL